MAILKTASKLQKRLSISLLSQLQFRFMTKLLFNQKKTRKKSQLEEALRKQGSKNWPKSFSITILQKIHKKILHTVPWRQGVGGPLRPQKRVGAGDELVAQGQLHQAGVCLWRRRSKSGSRTHVPDRNALGEK